MERCGAKTRSGGLCQNHPTRENGKRCRMHGGAKGTGRPITTGRYARVCKPKLQATLMAFLADPEPESTREELAMARSLYCDYLERAGSGDGEEQRAWLATIATLADKSSRVRSRHALTAAELDLIKVVIIRVVRSMLSPAEAREFWSRLADALGLQQETLPQGGTWSGAV